MPTKILSFVFLFLFSSVHLVAQTAVPEQEVWLKTSSGTISGSLLYPQQAEAVVIIVAGSGPTDRNGNSPLGIRANSYGLLAQGLCGKGIASLRYDKRGLGKSASALSREEDLTIDLLASDVSEWVSFLRKNYHFKKIILLGHSEGALISSISAQHAAVDGLIMLSGSGRPFDELIAAQLKANPNNPQLILDQSESILDSLKAGKQVKDIPVYFNALYRPSVQPYLISTLKYSPVEEFRKVKVPALIIQGDADLQVTPSDAELLRAAKPSAKLLIIPAMNHVLKKVGDTTDNQKAYADPQRPLAPELIPAIEGFIKDLLKK